jgi:hypothetical protein
MTRTSFVRRLWQILLAGLLFVATLEVSARVDAWWRWGAPLLGPYSSETLRITDDIGTRNRPGARFEKWVINSAGFRGPELSLEKAPGVVRVGVAGASEVFGLYEGPEKDLTSQLRAQLSGAAPGRFEVVNLASAGMSPPRIRELLERWAGRFDFDVIVVYPTPAFYLDYEPPARTLRRSAATGVVASSSVGLRLPDAIWKAGRQRLPAGLQAWLKRVQVERVRAAHPPEWVWKAAPPERVELFARDTLELVQAIEQAGARAVLATHAHRFSLPLHSRDSAQMDGWIRFYPRATAECLIDMERQANEVLRRIGGEQALVVVDVQEAVGKDPRHYADFSHFTDEGAARAAKALAAAILSAAR